MPLYQSVWREKVGVVWVATAAWTVGCIYVIWHFVWINSCKWVETNSGHHAQQKYGSSSTRCSYVCKHAIPYVPVYEIFVMRSALLLLSHWGLLKCVWYVKLLYKGKKIHNMCVHMYIAQFAGLETVLACCPDAYQKVPGKFLWADRSIELGIKCCPWKMSFQTKRCESMGDCSRQKWSCEYDSS